MAFYHGMSNIITKHSTSEHINGIDKDMGFKRYINILDFHGCFLVKNKLISEVDIKTFLLQKIWYQINEKLYYFTVKDSKSSPTTSKLNLFAFDISKQKEEEIDSYKYKSVET